VSDRAGLGVGLASGGFDDANATRVGDRDRSWRIRVARLEVRGASERLSVGAVVEVRLDTGEVAYLQYACPGWHAPIIRALPGTFPLPLQRQDLRRLVGGPVLFVTQFHLDGLITSRQGSVRGQLAVPAIDAGMPFFRTAVPRSERNPDGWGIIDLGGTDLTGQQFAQAHPGIALPSLPLWLIPLQPTLLRMLEAQWTPRLAVGNDLRLPPRPADFEPAAPASKPKPALHTAHVLYFEDDDGATRAAEQLVQEHRFLRADIAESSSPGEWLVWAYRKGRPRDEDTKLAARVAREHGGDYDGNIVGPLS
jgi:hypothetical protein